MQLYCESNNHNGIVVFDVSDIQDLEQFWNEKRIDKKWNSEDNRTLIEVINLSYLSYNGPREGHWYEIPFSFWQDFTFDSEAYSFDNENPSLLFRLRVNYEGEERKLDFYQYNMNSFDKWKERDHYE